MYKIMMFNLHADREKNVMVRQYIKVVGGLTWEDAKGYRAKAPGEFIIAPEVLHAKT